MSIIGCSNCRFGTHQARRNSNQLSDHITGRVLLPSSFLIQPAKILSVVWLVGLRTCETTAKDVVLVLVANKIDLMQERMVNRNDALKLSRDFEMLDIETSASKMCSELSYDLPTIF